MQSILLKLFSLISICLVFFVYMYFLMFFLFIFFHVWFFFWKRSGGRGGPGSTIESVKSGVDFFANHYSVFAWHDETVEDPLDQTAIDDICLWLLHSDEAMSRIPWLQDRAIPALSAGLDALAWHPRGVLRCRPEIWSFRGWCETLASCAFSQSSVYVNKPFQDQECTIWREDFGKTPKIVSRRCAEMVVGCMTRVGQQQQGWRSINSKWGERSTQDGVLSAQS